MDPAQRMIADPAHFANGYYDELAPLSRAGLEAVQVECVRRRFSQLRGRVAVLDRLANERGIDDVGCIDDVAQLLLPHTVFKAYPLQWLDEAQFGKLTRWLGALCALDLSAVDCSGIETVDDWIQHLDRQTDLRVLHTFGTSGKLSFVPRTRQEWQVGARIVSNCIRDWHGRESSPDLMTHRLPMVHPSYRFGAGAIQRGSGSAVVNYAGGDHNTLFLYPDARFSADVACLAGRLRAADLRGEADKLAISPRLQARQRELAQRERSREQDLRVFFEQVVNRYAGQDIYLLGVWPVLFDWAQAGLAAGLRKMFGPGTILHAGGGMKGRDLPEGWRDRIYEFVGVERHFEFYAMSELVCGASRCSQGNYHLPPVVMPFLLDPVTGELMPRRGRARGRFAAFDLIAESSWGGIITGDEVTLAGWDEPCVCGRPGTYVEADIRRYSVAEGGMDKISCAGAHDAYERAIEFLRDSAEAAA